MLTHLPFNKYCTVCQRAKMENARRYRAGGIEAHTAKSFGDHVTADTVVLHGMKDRGFLGEKNAIVFYDFATDYHDCIPCKNRSDSVTQWVFRHFIGPNDDVKLKRFYSDRAPELINAAKIFSACDDHSTPGMPRTNGIAENKVKLVLRGARALLRQAGLPAKYWTFACRAFCYGLNFDKMSANKSAWELRHGSKFTGHRLPFGCIVDYYPALNRPIPKKEEDKNKIPEVQEIEDAAPSTAEGAIQDDLDESDEEFEDEDNVPNTEHTDCIDSDDNTCKRPKFASSSIPGIFLGWEFQSGGKWQDTYIVANLNDLRRGKSRPRIDRVMKIYVDPDEGYVFPMRAIYDHLTRTVKSNKVKAASDGDPKEESAEDGYADDKLDFRFHDCDKDEPGPQRGTRLIKRRRDQEISFVDHWEYEPTTFRWIYHHVSWRKQMYVPLGSDDGPEWRDLDDARMTEMRFNDGTTKTVVERDILNHKRRRRIGQWWTGKSIFFLKGKCPDWPDDSIDASKKFLERPAPVKGNADGLPFKSPSRPADCDPDSWAEMSINEKVGYVSATREQNEEASDDDGSHSHYTADSELYAKLAEPQDIVSHFYDARGDEIDCVRAKGVSRYVGLSKAKAAAWPFVARIVTKKQDGTIMRDLKVVHKRMKGSTSTSSTGACAIDIRSDVICMTSIRNERKDKLSVRLVDRWATVPFKVKSHSMKENISCPLVTPTTSCPNDLKK